MLMRKSLRSMKTLKWLKTIWESKLLRLLKKTWKKQKPANTSKRRKELTWWSTVSRAIRRPENRKWRSWSKIWKWSEKNVPSKSTSNRAENGWWTHRTLTPTRQISNTATLCSPKWLPRENLRRCLTSDSCSLFYTLKNLLSIFNGTW